MKNLFKNKTILITGGTGSLGTKLTSIFLEKYSIQKLIIFSRDEQKQDKLKKNFNNKKLRFFIGDIRDNERLNFALKKVDIIIHAAALKHVPVAEYNPFEAIKTNILGSQNVINAAIQNNVKLVIALSTDKASSPVNLYGATKLASDKLFVAANNYSANLSKFSVIRYGNVFGSRGSIVPHLINLKNNTFSLTSEKMTRFNITLNESALFVIECLKKMQGGEIFIPKIPSYRILDLIKAVRPSVKIKKVGIRPGEKINEEMISCNEAINTIELKNSYIICPNSEYNNKNKDFFLRLYKNSKICKNNFVYSSEKNIFLSIDQLKKIFKLNICDLENSL